jgi:hypothetical protein
MPRLHILQGGIDNGDRDWLIRAAKQNLAARTWITPKSARPGDQAVIYVGATFFATGTISGRAARRPDWGRRAYGAGLKSIKLIVPPIGINTIKQTIPDLTWALYPRSVTTPEAKVAAEIRQLIGHKAFESHGEDVASDIELIINDKKIRSQTTRRALIDARLGQGRFRAKLIDRWNGACIL